MPAGIIAAVVIVFSYWQYVLPGNETLGRTFKDTVSAVSSGDFQQIYSANRIGTLLLTAKVLCSDGVRLLIGLGPGSSFVGNYFETPGALRYRYFDEGVTWTQISATASDVGILGLGVYCLLFYQLYKYLKRANKNAQSREERILVLASYGCFLFYVVLGPLYNIVWRSDASSYIFYFLMACVYKIANRQV